MRTNVVIALAAAGIQQHIVANHHYSSRYYASLEVKTQPDGAGSLHLAFLPLCANRQGDTGTTAIATRHAILPIWALLRGLIKYLMIKLMENLNLIPVNQPSPAWAAWKAGYVLTFLSLH